MLFNMLRWGMFLLAILAGGQAAPPPTDLGRVVAGSMAPDFELPSAAGGNLKLSNLRGKNVVLVFYRGYWCPYCVKQLVELQSLIPPSHRGDTPVVAVSPDAPDEIKRIIPIVTERTGSQFLIALLSDAHARTIDRYGLRNEEAAKEGTNLPYPTTYVIDKTGRVRWKFTEKNQAVRPTNEVLLAELKKLW